MNSSNNPLRRFIRVLGPDLFRSDHTPEELCQLAEEDNLPSRKKILRCLAFAIKEGVSNKSIGQYAAQEGINHHSAYCALKGMLDKYREGCLYKVFERWAVKLPKYKLDKFRKPFIK